MILSCVFFGFNWGQADSGRDGAKKPARGLAMAWTLKSRARSSQDARITEASRIGYNRNFARALSKRISDVTGGKQLPSVRSQ